MRHPELFDRCFSAIEALRLAKKLPIRTCATANKQRTKLCSGIAVSTTDGEAGLITSAWGFVFLSIDHPMRCTEIHTSYYGETVALGKLWQELKKMGKQS